MARCGRCRVVTVPDNQAWCADCGENDNPNNYVGGVHISQVELPDPDPWVPVLPASDFDLDAILNRVSADTLRELEATTDLEARLAEITGGVPQLLDMVTDSLAEDCYTNNPPELAVLEGVFYDYPLGPHCGAPVMAAFSAASRANLIRMSADQQCGWALSEAGEQRLADLWGPDRVPPGKGGHLSCWDHDVYEAAPGDLWACPDCQDADYAAVMRGIEADGDLILTDVLADAESQRLAVVPNIVAFEASRRRRKLRRKTLRRLGFLAALMVVALLAVVAIGRL